MSATRTLLAPGQIVDIRWGDQRDRKWLRAHLTPAAYREMAQYPQWFRREMSVYRCAGCGVFGALQGIGAETLMLWTMKELRCNACTGCDCEGCQAQRAEAGDAPAP